MEISSVKQRIVLFYKELGLNKREFERSINASNGYLDKLRNSPSPKKLEIIFLTYPQLNRVWLLSGEGDMLNTTTPKNNVENSDIIENLASTIKSQQETITRLMNENQQLREELRKFYSAKLA